MTSEQAVNRWCMWMLISLLFLRHGFRDQISDGWMAVSSVVFLVAAFGLLAHQVRVDSRNRY